MAKKSLIKNDYLKIYRESHNNAIGLLKEAKLLLEHEHYARAYTLAYTALEEISKSQLAADVFTQFSKEEEFLKTYVNHKDKINRVEWAHIDASSYPHNLIWVGPDKEDMEKMDPEKPLWLKRQKSLYVDIDDANNITTPSGSITENDAKSIIHVVEVALERIWEVTEYWGHQIGTKGFMK